MPVLADDIKFYRSETMDDTPKNGGRLSNQEIPDGPNNVWLDGSSEEKKNGAVHYRKIFIKNINDEGLAFLNPKFFIEAPAWGDNSVVLMAGTQTDTQAEAETYNRFYGATFLHSRPKEGDTAITFNVVAGNGLGGHEIYRDGDLIRISSDARVDIGGGRTQFIRLAKGGVSWSKTNETEVTLTFANGEELYSGYYGPNIKVSSVIEFDDIVAKEAVSVWEKRTIPADANPHTSNQVVVAITGESE